MVLFYREPFFPLRERAIDKVKESSDPNQLHKNLEIIIRTDVVANQKKVVFKVDMVDDKGKKKIAKAISGLSGIDSLAVDMKEKKLTVIGDVDPIQVLSKLRQKKWFTEILTVGPAKEEAKKEEQKKKDRKKETADLVKADQNYYPHYTHYRVMTLSSSVTQAARGKQKLVEEKAPLEDATVSNIRQLLESMDISAQAEASTSLSMPFVEDPYTVMLEDQDRTKDVMVERKRLLDDQEMSINRIVELERLLATQKALLATKRVVLEELIAKDEQIEELNRALEVEKKKENDYFRGVEDCRLKMLERYTELDLSWMDSEFGFKSMLGKINEVPASQEPFLEILTVGPAEEEKNPEG